MEQASIFTGQAQLEPPKLSLDQMTSETWKLAKGRVISEKLIFCQI